MHLEKRFGTKAGHMKLILKSKTGENLHVMSDDYACLAQYDAETDMTIHCIDEDPQSIVK